MLDLIVNGSGRPPTVRELATELGLSSPASVHRHLKKLAQEGLITQVPGGGSRSWAPMTAATSQQKSTNQERHSSGKSHSKSDSWDPVQQIPIVGRIAAGVPIESCLESGDTPDHWLDMPPTAFGQKSNVVALLVEGESMRDAGIHSGDHAIIRCQPKVENGEIAAVTIDGEGTLKRWRIASGRDQSSKVQLEAANPDFPPLELKKEMGEVQIFGKLIGVIRKFNSANSLNSNSLNSKSPASQRSSRSQ